LVLGITARFRFDPPPNCILNKKKAKASEIALGEFHILQEANKEEKIKVGCFLG
jgi:hypothetical protein